MKIFLEWEKKNYHREHREYRESNPFLCALCGKKTFFAIEMGVVQRLLMEGAH